jgi:RsiW-degrading membrane proteinase PrsW (M82 family)
VLGVGNLVLLTGVLEEYLFPPLFLLGALLPTAAVLAWSMRALGWPVTWRQGALMFVAGSTLSIGVIILLDSFLPYIFYLLVEPIGYLVGESLRVFYSGGPEFFERLFFSPMLIFYLLYIAFQAPFPEEFAKALGPALMGKRITNERQAFAVGLASGAGFAIMENMLYQDRQTGKDGMGYNRRRALALRIIHCGFGYHILALYRRERKPGWFAQSFLPGL